MKIQRNHKNGTHQKQADLQFRVPAKSPQILYEITPYDAESRNRR